VLHPAPARASGGAVVAKTGDAGALRDSSTTRRIGRRFIVSFPFYLKAGNA
jgi:hypothetical protein